MVQKRMKSKKGKRSIRFSYKELAETLAAVSDPSSPDYDPVFVAKLKAANPAWLKEDAAE